MMQNVGIGIVVRMNFCKSFRMVWSCNVTYGVGVPIWDKIKEVAVGGVEGAMESDRDDGMY
jgi:hypothetical protein